MTEGKRQIPQYLEEMMTQSLEDFLRLPQDLHETAVKFASEDIKNSIVFFGSARILPHDQAVDELNTIQANPYPEDPHYKDQLRQAENNLYMSRFYKDAEELAYKLTEWTLKHPDPAKHFLVCSGGGPGIMEASNKGAHRADGRSIGLSIEIPREQKTNRYVTPELDFTFDTFLIRKFWFFYFMKALVVFPGGVGTLDEFFEILTLITTKKLQRTIPIVLFGKEYWNQVIQFDALVRYGTITQKELDCFICADTIDEAFKYITEKLTQLYLSPDGT